MNNDQPIGVLDSGVGGLTIWKEIVALLPRESTLYIADSKNCPYGVKSPEKIFQLSKKLVKFLLDKNCKLIVIACNTITVTCIDRLRSEFRGIPIVGTVPVVKTAAEKSRSKRIGIFSTPVTANSQYQRDLINKFARECEVTSEGSYELVSFIEKGNMDKVELEKILKRELQVFLESYVDVLVLGCSHFPLVKKHIQKILGPRIQVLDSGGAVARQVKRILLANNKLSTEKKPTHEFNSTGDSEKFLEMVKKFR